MFLTITRFSQRQIKEQAKELAKREAREQELDAERKECERLQRQVEESNADCARLQEQLRAKAAEVDQALRMAPTAAPSAAPANGKRARDDSDAMLLLPTAPAAPAPAVERRGSHSAANFRATLERRALKQVHLKCTRCSAVSLCMRTWHACVYVHVLFLCACVCAFKHVREHSPFCCIT